MKRKAKFTLIELFVVLGIIGMLSGFCFSFGKQIVCTHRFQKEIKRFALTLSTCQDLATLHGIQIEYNLFFDKALGCFVFEHTHPALLRQHPSLKKVILQTVKSCDEVKERDHFFSAEARRFTFTSKKGQKMRVSIGDDGGVLVTHISEQ